jgi:hypothetical protein
VTRLYYIQDASMQERLHTRTRAPARAHAHTQHLPLRLTSPGNHSNMRIHLSSSTVVGTSQPHVLTRSHELNDRLTRHDNLKQTFYKSIRPDALCSLRVPCIPLLRLGHTHELDKTCLSRIRLFQRGGGMQRLRHRERSTKKEKKAEKHVRKEHRTTFSIPLTIPFPPPHPRHAVFTAVLHNHHTVSTLCFCFKNTPLLPL